MARHTLPLAAALLLLAGCSGPAGTPKASDKLQAYHLPYGLDTVPALAQPTFGPDSASFLNGEQARAFTLEGNKAIAFTTRYPTDSDVVTLIYCVDSNCTCILKGRTDHTTATQQVTHYDPRHKARFLVTAWKKEKGAYAQCRLILPNPNRYDAPAPAQLAFVGWDPTGSILSWVDVAVTGPTGTGADVVAARAAKGDKTGNGVADGGGLGAVGGRKRN